ncbi:MULTISPECIES: sphingomyelin phosphodiesterase [unclassified Streptomyces]|uniref:sphingomyelin phosphodiesterase n=1 Tax=unclassified Streptomyces TaxID=2593676 RepID=UPI0038260460
MALNLPRTALAVTGAALLLSQLPTGTAAAATSTPSLSVMAFNVEQLPSITEIAGTPGSDRKAIRSKIASGLIQRENADVVVLDEAFNVYAEGMRRELRQRYPYQSSLVGEYCSGQTRWTSYAGNCSNSPFVVNGGVTILSKYPIAESHQLVYNNSDSNTSDYKSNKGAALVRLNVGGAPVWVAGTHLQADEPSSSPIASTRQVRLKQLQELRSWASEKAGARPVIVAGDFNVEYYKTDPGNGHAPIDLDSSELSKADRALGGKLAPQQISAYTYDMVDNARAKLRDDEKKSYAKYRNRLDYIGYINGTAAAPSFTQGRVVSYDDLPMGADGDPLSRIPSDHQPLVSRVTLAQ